VAADHYVWFLSHILNLDKQVWPTQLAEKSGTRCNETAFDVDFGLW